MIDLEPIEKRVRIVIREDYVLCRHCEQMIGIGRQIILVELLQGERVNSAYYIHLECWLPYQETLNDNRRNLMTNKVTKPLDPASLPGINEAVESTKQWDYTHAEVQDTSLIILTAEPIQTMYGDAFLCKCQIKDETVKVMFGAVVLVQTIDAVKDKLPVRATVVKPGQFYQFK